jgi:hypothetical protein
LYRQDQKSDTSFGFVDFIPRFRSIFFNPDLIVNYRAIGERVLQGHVEEQKNTLLVLLSRVNVHIAEESSEYDQTENGRERDGEKEGELNNEEAAGILVKHMGKLKTQWQSVLQESVYNR